MIQGFFNIWKIETPFPAIFSSNEGLKILFVAWKILISSCNLFQIMGGHKIKDKTFCHAKAVLKGFAFNQNRHFLLLSVLSNPG